MRSINLSESEALRIDQEIASLQTKRDKIRSKAVMETAVLLEELRCSQFKVSGFGIWITPSDRMKEILPKNVGSQDQFSIPLDGEYRLDISDWGVCVWSNDREDIAGRLKWLAIQGVNRNQVVLNNEGIGSVAYAEYQLEKAIEEQRELLAKIEQAFV